MDDCTWEDIAEHVRDDMRDIGIDLNVVAIALNPDGDEEDDERFFQIWGLKPDESETARAIIGCHCTVIDGDFDPCGGEDFEEEDE